MSGSTATPKQESWLSEKILLRTLVVGLFVSIVVITNIALYEDTALDGYESWSPETAKKIQQLIKQQSHSLEVLKNLHVPVDEANAEEPASVPDVKQYNPPMKTPRDPLKKEFKPKKLHLFSFADKFVDNICGLASTAYHYGTPLNVFAWDGSTHFFDHTTCGEKCQKPKNYGEAKLRKMYWLKHFFNNYKEYGLGDDDVVIFSDAHDVFGQRNMSDVLPIYSRLLNNQRGVIFNGEATCGASFNDGGIFGRQVRSKNYRVKLRDGSSLHTHGGGNMCDILAAKGSMSPTRGPYWSLNSGVFMGDVKTMQDMMNKMVEISKEQIARGDQIIFHRTYLRYPELNIIVDTNAELFFCWSYLVNNKFDIPFTESGSKHCTDGYMPEDGVPSKHTLTNTRPFFMHFPGAHRSHYKPCVKQVTQYTKQDAGQYFMDVDRRKKVMLNDLCPGYN